MAWEEGKHDTEKAERKNSMPQRTNPRNKLHCDSSRRNLSSVMNLRKPDFSAEMIKQQREGNKNIKARKTN